MVAHETTLAPGLLPFFIDGRLVFRAFEFEAAHHVVAVGQDETQLGRRDQQLALAADAVIGPAITVELDIDGD